MASLDQDRILRSYLTLIQATLRTSFYQKRADGRPKSYVAFKLDPQAIPDLPAPRPKFEIFVYSPRFEGVHLRFGPVARGGLRWSDRREDFRTEVLGLVKAQMVKNAVIVPVGAKGGFVLKQKPGDRDEAVACYQEFVGAMLDVTDNIVGGQIVPPEDVVRHDGDDPYLVVAADKGTATFSDIANEISTAHNFWLGDAFASGGSAGYDHKKMGITARGAWESVKRHFRELGHDTQTQDFTVVGVGDMSGDVFGNGMLLSEHIRLVAAFDHRHIFLDPDPDAATSYAERRAAVRPAPVVLGGLRPGADLGRRRGLPAYREVDPDHAAGPGGARPGRRRHAAVAAGADEGDPDRAGGPVLERRHRHLRQGVHPDQRRGGRQVQRRDPGGRPDLRCRVVGEGGNLGCTQLGRIEYALAGGRIYTDFIDNAAGVDSSDHEVNIKILLNTAVADGELTVADRDELLAEMTDEVAELVLRDNYDQARAINNAQAQAASLLPVHRRMINELERSGGLDRALEALPPDEELAVRSESGLTAPEFAVLLAYVKIVLEREILAEGLADEEWTTEVLVNYFPTPMRERFADRMGRHRLRRDIVTTVLVNEAINRGGISFIFRVVEETAASAADVIRAYVVVREVFGLRELWDAVEALDNKVPPELQTSVYLDTRRLLDRAVRWLVTNRRSPIDVPAEIARLRDGVTRLLPGLEDLFYGSERQGIAAHIDSMTERGLPRELAERATRLMYSFGLLDVVETATPAGGTSARWPRSTSCSPTGSGWTRCCRRSPCCRGRTAGRRWPGWRCATTCTPRWPRSPRRCSTPPRATCRRTSGCSSGSSRTPPRSTGPAGRWGSSTSRGPTSPPCRCCCARSAPWCGPPRPPESVRRTRSGRSGSPRPAGPRSVSSPVRPPGWRRRRCCPGSSSRPGRTAPPQVTTRRPGRSLGPYTSSVGKAVFGYDFTASTVKVAGTPSARRTVTVSPGVSAPRSKKTAGPSTAESTCPTITALPVSPGLAPGSYHPAWSAWSSGGTWTVPSGLVPNDMIVASTPIRGISMLVGAERANPAAA